MPHGLGHHVIMKMADRFLERGHHLFFDNYFSSVKLGQNLEETGTYTCSTIRMNRSGWPKELNAQCAKKMKAGDIHFRQDGNMVATLWKDKRPVAILSTNAQPEMGKQKGRHQGASRRWRYPNQFWHTTTAWGASTWLTSTTLITLLDSHLYGGGDTFVGGCCRRPWSSLSSSGAKATSLLQPGRGSAMWIFASMCSVSCVKGTLSGTVTALRLCPRLEWPPPSLCHTQLNSFRVPKRTAVCV